LDEKHLYFNLPPKKARLFASQKTMQSLGQLAKINVHDMLNTFMVDITHTKDPKNRRKHLKRRETHLEARKANGVVLLPSLLVSAEIFGRVLRTRQRLRMLKSTKQPPHTLLTIFGHLMNIGSQDALRAH
jgi:hypothetical protein